MALRRALARGQYALSTAGFLAGAAIYLSTFLGHPADARWVFAVGQVAALVLFGTTLYWIFDLTDDTCRGPGSFSWNHVWRGSPRALVRLFYVVFYVSLGGALGARYLVAASDRVASALLIATGWMFFYGISALTALSWLRARGNSRVDA